MKAIKKAAKARAKAAALAKARAKAAKARAAKARAASRSLPRAGSPTASQRYAKAYIAQKYGWGAGQFSCLKVMWNRESGWRYWASNPNGRYHGIPQTSSVQWRKYGYTTSQYMRNPAVQIRWARPTSARATARPAAPGRSGAPTTGTRSAIGPRSSLTRAALGPG